jgi:asparagine synthase (glutamine-hydrolysing)
MSGFFAVINSSNQTFDPNSIDRMLSSMRYRGPDGSNIWTGERASLGYAHLQIGGQADSAIQPRTFDDQIWIVGDVRIDGRRPLMASLRSNGLTPAQDCQDIELVLHAYLVWGRDCLQHLLGDFAFVIWNESTKHLFAARDHFGVKPFFYASIQNQLITSNTLNTVRAHPEVSDTLNDCAIIDFLAFGHLIDPQDSAFAQIKRLPAAHYLEGSAQDLKIQRYWSLPTDGHIRYKHSRDYIDHFRHLMQQSVADRMRGERVSVLMSGGMDSSSVAAFAANSPKTGGPTACIKAFTGV